MFIKANGLFPWNISIILPKKIGFRFFRLPLLIINESKICGIRSNKRFDGKMFVQVSITFSNLRLAFSFSLELFKVSLWILLFVLFLMNWFKYKHFRSTLDEEFSSSIFEVIRTILSLFIFFLEKILSAQKRKSNQNQPTKQKQANKKQ